jgi:hypothetical protein
MSPNQVVKSNQIFKPKSLTPPGNTPEDHESRLYHYRLAVGPTLALLVSTIRFPLHKFQSFTDPEQDRSAGTNRRFVQEKGI